MIVQLKENIKGNETPFKTVLEYSKTSDGWRFYFTCHNSMLYSASDKYNDPIYRGDVCEIFLCLGEDLSNYYEIEVAPNGTVFFAKIKNQDGLHVTYLPKQISTAVEITKEGYNVEIIIPFTLIGEEKLLRFNAFRIETEGGIENKNLLALSPTLCERFHCPEKFILLET